MESIITNALKLKWNVFISDRDGQYQKGRKTGVTYFSQALTDVITAAACEVNSI